MITFNIKSKRYSQIIQKNITENKKNKMCDNNLTRFIIVA